MLSFFLLLVNKYFVFFFQMSFPEGSCRLFIKCQQRKNLYVNEATWKMHDFLGLIIDIEIMCNKTD